MPLRCVEQRHPRRHQAHPRPVAPQQLLAVRRSRRRQGEVRRPEYGVPYYVDRGASRFRKDDADAADARRRSRRWRSATRTSTASRTSRNWSAGGSTNRTGGGLMAELGSHQLDAVDLPRQRPPARRSGRRRQVLLRPGQNDRESDDHVFVTFEFPGKNHPKAGQGRQGRERHRRRHLLVDQHQRVRELRRVRHGQPRAR